MMLSSDMSLALAYRFGNVPLINWLFLGSLPSVLTFTRASSGTCFNSSGVLESVAADAPRFDYDPYTLEHRGLLMEEQRTNLNRYSNDLAGRSTSKSWQTENDTSHQTETANYGIAPDGTQTSTRLRYLASGGAAEYAYVYNQWDFLSAVVGTTYQLSFYARSSAGASLRYAWRMQGGTWGSLAQNTVTLSNVWTRYTLPLTYSSSAYTPRIEFDALTLGADVELWGVQVEVGDQPTSVIITSGSVVTRAADRLYITELSPWFNTMEGTFVTESIVHVSARSTRAYSAGFSDGTGNNVIAAMYETTGVPTGAEVVSGSVVLSGQTLAAVTPYAINKMALRYKATDNQFACNGLTDTDGTLRAAGVPAVNRVDIGNNAVNTRALNGWVRSFRYWSRAMSETEIQQVTT